MSQSRSHSPSRSRHPRQKSTFRVGVITETRVKTWMESLGFQTERVKKAGMTKFGAQDPFGVDLLAKRSNLFVVAQVKTSKSGRAGGKKQVEAEQPWPSSVQVLLVLWPTEDHKNDRPTEIWRAVVDNLGIIMRWDREDTWPD